eukprot:8082559-Heterocapsa_arctica.AAC.1
MSGVYNCLYQRRGCVYEENPREGTPLVQVKVHLPLYESFGLDGALRQALQEHVNPVLFYKMDRYILELQMEQEDMYNCFRKAIEDVNVFISTYNDELMSDSFLNTKKK